jgi:benzoyl-CoA reductase/2-hydroxyglutaryl-CoA dehydratase subunit BcrC/BadD/HgdB
MTDVNEEIVAKYFELKEYLVTPNLKYMMKKEKSSGESDIDLAVYNIKTGDRAIVEVKGWHTETFTPAYFKPDAKKEDYRSRIFHFVRKEALDAARKFFETDKFRKILVVSKLPKSYNSREECIKLAKKKGIDEIIEFSEILNYIISKTKTNKNYKDSMVQQMIRLLKNYNLTR